MYNTLKALLLIAPRKDVRYYLNGINCMPLETGGALLQATDGHTLIQVEVESDGIEENVVLCATSLATVMKMFTAKTPLTLTVSKGVAELNGFKVETVDGRFPDIQRVMWQGCAGRAGLTDVAFSFKVLKKLVAALSLLGAAGEFKFKDDALAVVMVEFGKVKAAVMPYRFTKKD